MLASQAFGFFICRKEKQMTANISKDSKIASIHSPEGKSAMAGVLSYPGIKHKVEDNLSCYGSDEMDI